MALDRQSDGSQQCDRFIVSVRMIFHYYFISMLLQYVVQKINRVVKYLTVKSVSLLNTQF